MQKGKLSIENVAQLKRAEVSFGDLTVLVGPQASGKSILLHLFKLAMDAGHINSVLKKNGMHWNGELSKYLSLYLGEGMESAWSDKSKMLFRGREVDIEAKMKAKKSNEASFFIPAQRVITLSNGWPRPFTDYNSGDPYVVRHFSELIRHLMEAGLGSGSSAIFPQPGRLKKDLRHVLSRGIFSGSELRLDTHGLQKRIILQAEDSTLPFMVWSAGQREFIPLLLGLYWLLPPSKKSKHDNVNWVIIEEPETGLHPQAVSGVLLAVMELLDRGYKVVVSTHSTHILDFVWGWNMLQSYGADPGLLLDMLDAPKTQALNEVAKRVVKSSARVYYFERQDEEVSTRDISRLDPGAEDVREWGWGGLAEFSGRVSDVVSRMVQELEE
jgi:energy-coupling factor transporter ATP-binding protein EcfA2